MCNCSRSGEKNDKKRKKKKTIVMQEFYLNPLKIF